MGKSYGHARSQIEYPPLSWRGRTGDPWALLAVADLKKSFAAAFFLFLFSTLLLPHKTEDEIIQ